MGDGSAGLDRVDHDHELFEGKLVGRDAVLHGARAVRANVYAELAKRVEVRVDALPLGRDAMLGEPLDDLGHREAVLGVGLFPEDLEQVENLDLRLAVVRHRAPPSANACGYDAPSIASRGCEQCYVPCSRRCRGCFRAAVDEKACEVGILFRKVRVDPLLKAKKAGNLS